MRSNPTYYINPNAISLTPNANNSANDIAVYIQSGTRIKVYSTYTKGDGTKPFDYDQNANSYKTWPLEGRNRRLNTAAGQGGTFTGPFTIYARIDASKAYIVFARKESVTQGGITVWKDKYPYLTRDGMTTEQSGDTGNYTYVKMGEVSPIGTDPSDPDTYQKRTITLDTGILGTEQYNNQWQVIEDEQPLRVEIANTKGASAPQLGVGETIGLTANLVKGFRTMNDDVVKWTIERDTGDADVDEAWNDEHADAIDTQDRSITLSNAFGVAGDFNASTSATFTVKAWGAPPQEEGSSSDSSDEPEPVLLAEGSIIIYAEPVIYSSYGVLNDGTTETVIDDTNVDDYFTIGGKRAKARAFFNPNPTQASPSAFTPAMHIDQTTGTMTAARGNFGIDEDGNVFMKGTVNAKAGVFSGFVKKSKTVITRSNISSYQRTEEVSPDTYREVIDLEKAGTFLSFEGNFHPVVLGLQIVLEIIDPSVSDYTEAYKERVRSYVGNTILVYNNSDTNATLGIAGRLLKEDGTIVNSVSLGPGYCATLTYETTFTVPSGETDAYEDIYLRYRVGKIR